VGIVADINAGCVGVVVVIAVVAVAGVVGGLYCW